MRGTGWGIAMVALGGNFLPNLKRIPRTYHKSTGALTH